MLGRGVDQILAHPGPPALREPYVQDARYYVKLAEQRNGSIPRPVDPDWPWGVARPALDTIRPDARIINLETSITGRGRFDTGKSVHYRMHPDNIAALTAAHPDVCMLANNHVMDFGRVGLQDTLEALRSAGLHSVGAGRDLAEAEQPAAVPLPDGSRLLVFAVGMPSSGVPHRWAATASRWGVAFEPEPGPGPPQLAERVRRLRKPEDTVVVSVHWGSNWSYDVPGKHIRLAHEWIDAGADLVYGHSSHHPRPIEIYRDKLILYGCGDFIDDYEGISGYEEFRDDLRIGYLAAVDRASGELERLQMLPFQARRMRLEYATKDDRAWLASLLTDISRPFGPIAPSWLGPSSIGL